MCIIELLYIDNLNVLCCMVLNENNGVGVFFMCCIVSVISIKLMSIIFSDCISLLLVLVRNLMFVIKSVKLMLVSKKFLILNLFMLFLVFFSK